MHIIEDTRNKIDKHSAKNDWFAHNFVSVYRSKLPFGDYALAPKRAVDTKQTIYELAMDIDQEHERFKQELVNAKKYGCTLYILVENTDGVRSLTDLSRWVEEYDHFAIRMAKSIKARRIEGMRLAKACKTMNERYGAVFLFCSPEDAGRKIVEILSYGVD